MNLNQENDLVEAYMAYTEESESPKCFLRWTALAGISAVAQRKIWIDWGDLRWYPNLYVILAGPPATRKSTAMKDMKNFLMEAGVPIGADAITREKFIRRLGESQTTVMTDEMGSFFNHCSISLWSSELSSLINKSTEQIIMDLTDLYDAPERWEYDTKHQGTDVVYGCYVSFIAATTPTSFRYIVPTSAIGSGFTSRVIFVCARAKEKRSPCPTFASSDAGQEIKAFIMQRLLDIYASSGVFKGTKGFAERYVTVYSEMPDTPPFDPDNFAHYWDRRMQNIMKLSMLFALSRGAGCNGNPHVLDVMDFDRAYNTLTTAEKDMPLIFADFGRSKMAGVLQKVLDIAGSSVGGVLVTDLTKRLIKDVSSYELQTIIDTLLSARLLCSKVTAKGTVLWRPK